MTDTRLATMAGAPWNVLDESGLRVGLFHSNNLQGQATAEDEARAARAVACWNACQGIPAETLEAGVVVVPVAQLNDALHDLAFIVATECVKGSKKTILVDRMDKALAKCKARLQQNGGDDHD